MSGDGDIVLDASWIEALPVRARVALALGTAERRIAELPAGSSMREDAQVAIDDAWRWAAGDSIPTEHLYEHVHKLMGLEPALAGKARAIEGLHALMSALYFTTWQADRVARLINPLLAPLPNDIAEGSEEDLTATLEYAVQAAPDEQKERAWQEAAARELFTRSGNDTDFAAGPAIRQLLRNLRVG